jgi:hypothetical protein
MAYGAVFGIAGLAACVAWFGPGFLEHLSSPRSSSAERLLTMIRLSAPVLAIPAVVLAILIRQLRHDRHAMFAVLIAAVSLLIGITSLYKDGVYWNAMFDAAWGLSLTAAIALNRLPSVSRLDAARVRWTLIAGYLVVPLAVVAGSASIHWGSPRFWLDPRWAEVESTAREVEFISSRPGPALCENLALCYWAGKPPEVDFFSMSQRFREDPQSAGALVRLLDEQRFRVAQLDRLHDLGSRVDAAIARGYAVDHDGAAGSLLLPR